MSTSTPPATSSVPRQSGGGTVSRLERRDGSGLPPGCQPIPGMKAGWLFRADDRMILHQARQETPPLAIDSVPRVLGTILHLTDDGETIRIEYLIAGRRQRRARIVTEDELDRGTWSAKVGQNRPNSSDAKQAFATIIRSQANEAEEIPARAYYNEDGDLVLPGPEAQAFGYRVTAGTEAWAKEAWDEIAAWAIVDPQSALVLGAVFVGPVLDSLDVLAHIVNLVGPGQKGKSTALYAATALLGDVKPRRQQLLGTWNSSKQGITQGLRARGFLPLALDEHSSSGRSVKESAREFSQIVAGAIRQMGTADGSPRETDGFWHSVLLSSSNDELRFLGQTEDLASRLHEIRAPFFPNCWVDSEGAQISPEAGGAEHLSKRIKRLAKSAGGWPLEWAVRRGLYRAENLRALKKKHLELCARHSPRLGGISDTIAEIHMAWVVGALMLEQILDVQGLGAAAERAAAERMASAFIDAAEANLPEGEKLWLALDGMRLDAAAYPDMDDVVKAAEDTFQKPKGFMQGALWWLSDSVVLEAVAQAGVENRLTALRQLNELGVYLRPLKGKHSQRLLPQPVRYKIGTRMHCFDTERAAALFGQDDEGGTTPGTNGTTPRNHSEPPQVVPDSDPLTCGGTTGTTGTTPLELDLRMPEEETTPGTAVAGGKDGGATAVRRDVTRYPEPEELRASDAGTSGVWKHLELTASGWAAGALRIGVLGADGLWLPNRKPVPVPLPGNVDQVPELMRAYGLRTLWVHESAALTMGLPSLEERLQGPRVDGKVPGQEPNSRIGAQTYTVHPWATPAEGSQVTVNNGGLSSWLTLETPTAEGKERLFVALPMYDRRGDRIDIEGNRQVSGFCAAPTPAVLLDALMVFTEASRYGKSDDPKVIGFYQSVNKTAIAYAEGDRGPVKGVWSDMIRDRQVPALAEARRALVNMQWTRSPERITAAERACMFLHQYDRNASYLHAFNVPLGLGEPVHHTEGCAFDSLKAGYWRVAELPGFGIENLPPLTIDPAKAGGYWLRTPGMGLMRELYPAWEPQIVEAWVWPESSRVMEAFYKRVTKTRKQIAEAAAAGRPGAKYAKQVSGKLYQSFWGYMHRQKGPQVNYETGDWYEKDLYWRHDWAQIILDYALANTYRAVKRAADAGHYPLSFRVDAVTYASDEVDAVAAVPPGLELSDLNGKWKAESEKTVPLASVLPGIEGGLMAPDAARDYLKALHKVLHQDAELISDNDDDYEEEAFS